MLATEVPNWSEIERMSVRRSPLAASAPKSEAARIYAQLWREIRARSGMRPESEPAAAQRRPLAEDLSHHPQTR